MQKEKKPEVTVVELDWYTSFVDSARPDEINFLLAGEV